VLHNPAFLTFFVHPGWEHVLRLAPWEMHFPPWTTRLGQSGKEHLRRGPPFLSSAVVGTHMVVACGCCPTAALGAVVGTIG